MPQLVVKYWRDIPSMVVIGRGRQAAKASLPERFEQAIDRCAMKIGAKEADAYLAEWRNEDRGEAPLADGEDAQAHADRLAAELDATYDREALKALIDNDGWRKE